MQKTKHKRTAVDFKKLRKSMTIPNQSMSIQEIVKRFVRGIPVDVVQRQKTYIDQQDFDLEKMSRLDFSDKAYRATELRAQSDYLAERIRANEQAKHEREKERQEATKQQEREAQQRTGIDNLDNTMPVDTDLTNRKLRGQKN